MANPLNRDIRNGEVVLLLPDSHRMEGYQVFMCESGGGMKKDDEDVFISGMFLPIRQGGIIHSNWIDVQATHDKHSEIVMDMQETLAQALEMHGRLTHAVMVQRESIEILKATVEAKDKLIALLERGICPDRDEPRDSA